MKRSLLSLILILSLCYLSAQIQRPIGTNIAGIVDWSTEYVFVDAFKQSREWIAHDMMPGAPWSSGVDIPLGPDGYPLEIPYDNGMDPPQAIRTLMFFGDLQGRYPAGMYRLIAEGSGQISLWGAAQGTFQCPVDTLVMLSPTPSDGVALEIESSLASDPVRDIHFVMPGFHQHFEKAPFHPEFLSFLEDFQCIRFMDWMKTNGSPVKFWADRNTVSNYSQTLANGVAYEYIIDLCNLLQKDAWICIPHQADDDFVEHFAEMLRDSLDPQLKIYIEYSNEVWNGIFSQNQYAADTALALGYTGQPWERSWKYTAKRSADIFVIFEQVFVDDSRFVKVVPAWAASPWVTNFILDRFEESTYNATGITADAVAIAPYFAGEVANRIGDNGLISSITIPAILDSMELAMETVFGYMDECKAVADSHQVAMIAYEGGQHLVATWPHIEDTTLTRKLIEANRHSRMEDLYCQYFNYWYDSTGGGLFANFSSHGLYSKYGSWGVKEFMEDTLSSKYLGLQQCVFSYNQDTTTAIETPFPISTQIWPNPSNETFIFIETPFYNSDIQLFDLSGRAIDFKLKEIEKGKFAIYPIPFRGMAILLIQHQEYAEVKRVIFR